MRLMKVIVKTVAVLALFAVVGVAVLLGVMWLDRTRATTLQTATGQFAVGHTICVWSDTTTYGS